MDIKWYKFIGIFLLVFGTALLLSNISFNPCGVYEMMEKNPQDYYDGEIITEEMFQNMLDTSRTVCYVNLISLKLGIDFMAAGIILLFIYRRKMRK